MGRATQITGKIGENVVIGEFLKRGMDVYIPVVDIKGIDCVIRTDSGKYFDIQIKTRATVGQGKQIFDVKEFEIRDNLFIVCYRQDLDTLWILPSKVFKEYSYYIPKYRRYRLILNPKKQRLLKDYENNFDQLMG